MTFVEHNIEYSDMKNKTGFTITYKPKPSGGVVVRVVSDTKSALEIDFTKVRVDEAHILYMELVELLNSRANLNQSQDDIRNAVGQLFSLFRGEKQLVNKHVEHKSMQVIGDYKPNPNKKLEIVVDGIKYLRLPIKTSLISMDDTDILPLIKEYVRPHIRNEDLLFVSEKALTITQGRVVDMSTIKPTFFARFLARNIGNYYGTENFRGFGHGTDIAMQAFIDEAGISRVIFAAFIALVTKPFGIHGMFYRICGTRAKSIDCPMSFLILEYAHSVKLAPNNPSGTARKIKELLGGIETIILDANYRGAISLGKTTRNISEKFIGKLFRDNPLGQSDEMTPFCIVRKVS